MNRRLRTGAKSFYFHKILFLIGFLTVCLFSFLSPGKSQEIQGLAPKPEKPQIITIAPTKNLKLSQAIPILPFVDNQVPQNWLYANPVTKGLGKKVVAALEDDLTDKSILKQFKPLPKDNLLKESWPDFTDAINLKALGKDQPEVRSVFYTLLNFNQNRLLRVCHGVAGLNVSADMWIAGTPVKHGALIRVRKGLYPIVVEVYHGKRTQWLEWKLARLATRLTEITEQEIEEVYQWELAKWQANIDMAKANEDQLLASVKFDPKTIRGKEGFFRVGKSVNGRWWFIDPEGKAFYHKGSTGLNSGGMGGRRANLPPVSEETAKKWLVYLKEWGFNAMGAWTTPEFFDKGMPFTEIIETFYEKPWLKTKFPDVWNPQWRNNLDAKCQKLCTPLKNNKMLLGYFLDNERGFMEVLKHNERIISNAPTYRYGEPIKDNQLELAAEPKLNIKGIGLLQFSLSQPEDVAASKKAWDFILERHVSLEGLSKAWQIEVKSKDAIKNLTAQGELLISKTYLKDQYDFVKLWVEQYYRVVSETIHKYDPNHLLLGVRWGGTPGLAVLETERKWADVVSRNNYRANFYEIFDDFYQQVQRPILNGELSTWTDSYSLIRNPIEPPGGYDPATRRAIRAREAMDRIFSHPGVIGYTKYRWHGGLWKDDSPQMDVVNPLRLANSRAVSIATSWERSPAKTEVSLHGQIFMSLRGGAVEVKKLLTNQEGEQDSFKLKTHDMIIGLVCRHGIWDKEVYGNGIRGEIIDSKTEDKQIELTLKIRKVPTLITQSKANAEYILKLISDDRKLEGVFNGNYNDHKVEGRALGYIYRPVPTLRY